MTEHTVHVTRRGRPIGSGIDDSTILDDLAELRARYPEMSVTRALKRLGIEDESRLRRIRDKYKARWGK